MNNLAEIDKKENLESIIDFKTIDASYDGKINIAKDILKANETGLINNLIDSNLALRPKLILNDYNKGSKVLSDIVAELMSCNKFMISVAFITSSGVTPLLETFKYLEENGIKGEILTTDYLNFSEPKALKKLLEFSNIHIKLYSKDSFHTKGYIFKHSDHYKLIIGSSNLTQSALTKNKEWNVKMSSLEEGSLTGEVLSEFKSMWNEADNLTLEWIETYEKIYLKQRESARKSIVPRISQYILKPNKMQVSAIQALDNIREIGAKKLY